MLKVRVCSLAKFECYQFQSINERAKRGKKRQASPTLRPQESMSNR